MPPAIRRRHRHRAILALAALILAGLSGIWRPSGAADGPPPQSSTYEGVIARLGDGLKENLAFRKVHDDVTDARARVRAYTNFWDLSDLQPYQPKQQVTGTVRVSGNYLVLGQIADLWKAKFARLQPGITLVAVQKGDLAKGEIDIQTGPRMMDRIGEISDFERQAKHPPLEIEWATGAFATPGWSPAFTIFVHKDNPLSKLSMNELDGIFGGSRSGGWSGTTWLKQAARGPEKNLRTWGQLGLTGEWADAPIHVLGRPLKYNIQLGFERKVFHGGDVWNENVREYAHELNPDGTRYTSSIEMVKDLSKDKLAICFADLGSLTPDVKMVAIASTDGGPYAELTLDSLHERTYPLYLEQWAYVNQEPGKPLEPAVKEFLSFMLSRDGQEAIQQDGKWLPIPARVTREQSVKLDGLGPTPKPGEQGLQVPLISPAQTEGETADELATTKPRKAYYTKAWDLSDLPAYTAATQLTGTIRLPPDGQLMAGTLGAAWMQGFAKHHPGVTFELRRGDLISKQIDLQVGRKWTSYFGGEYMAYQLKHKQSPVEIQVATGSYDVAGWNPALAIYVNADNPLAKLSVAELDGIFGGPRRGGWVGTAWRREVGRGAEKNIRTWGQLGLAGAWANRAITVYTRPAKYHVMSVFERKVLQGANMWNDDIHEVPSSFNPDGTKIIAPIEILKAVAADKGAITFGEKGLERAGVKTLAIAPYAGGEAAPLSLETVRNRTYPLALEVYAYAGRTADKSVDPAVNEFLRYVLSREGQDAVQRDGKWLPLTPALAAEELKKLAPAKAATP